MGKGGTYVHARRSSPPRYIYPLGPQQQQPVMRYGPGKRFAYRFSRALYASSAQCADTRGTRHAAEEKVYNGSDGTGREFPLSFSLCLSSHGRATATAAAVPAPNRVRLRAGSERVLRSKGVCHGVLLTVRCVRV